MWPKHSRFGVLLASGQLWRVLLKLVIVAAAVTAVLVFAFAAFVVVLPLALVGGFALHLFIRHRLRQGSHRRGSSGDLVIDAEYTVIDKAPDDKRQSRSYSPHPEKRVL